MLNKKNYTSDYILNKGAFKSVNNNFSVDSQNDPNETKENSNNSNNSNNSLETKKRVLPKLNKNLKQNSVDQLEMSEKFRMASNTTQLIKELSEESLKIKQNELKVGVGGLMPSSNIRKSLKQPLIKQASLNNPPTYFQHLNNDFFQDESSMYENSTSNLNLKNSVSFQNKNSHTTMPRAHNSRSSLFKERLQDPMLLFKNRNTSNSRLNTSNYDLNDIDLDESTLYSKEKNLNMISKTQSKEISDNKEKTNLNRELVNINESNKPQLKKQDSFNCNKTSNPNETAINKSLK